MRAGRLRTPPLDGEPSVLLSDGTTLWIGTRGPDAIMRLDEDLTIRGHVAITLPAGLQGAFGNPVSTTPVSLARCGDRLWIVTRGGAGASGLLDLSKTLTGKVEIPHYFPTLSFELNDIRLAGDGVQVWGPGPIPRRQACTSLRPRR